MELEQKKSTAGETIGGLVILLVLIVVVRWTCCDSDDAGKNRSAHDGAAIEQTASAKPEPTRQPENTDSGLARERSTFNKKRGSNREAASTAEGLIAMFSAQTQKHLDAYLKLEGDEDGFARGIPLGDYRRSVNVAWLTVVAPPTFWNSLPAGQKKDIVAGWVQALKKLYPGNGLRRVEVSNGVRTVAEGDWSLWNGEPDVTLK